jgi:hypothetical protein
MKPKDYYGELDSLRELYDDLKSNFPINEWYSRGAHSIRRTEKSTEDDKKYEPIYSLCDSVRTSLFETSISILLYKAGGKTFEKERFYQSADTILDILVELEEHCLNLT